MNNLNFIGLATQEIYITHISEQLTFHDNNNNRDICYHRITVLDDTGVSTTCNCYDLELCKELLKSQDIKNNILDKVSAGKVPDLVPSPTVCSFSVSVRDGRKAITIKKGEL